MDYCVAEAQKYFIRSWQFWNRCHILLYDILHSQLEFEIRYKKLVEAMWQFLRNYLLETFHRCTDQINHCATGSCARSDHCVIESTTQPNTKSMRDWIYCAIKCIVCLDLLHDRITALPNLLRYRISAWPNQCVPGSTARSNVLRD